MAPVNATPPGTITATEKAERDEQLSCRFYEQEYPEVDECVMVLVKNIADMGAYVELVEYNNIEGMILLSELSRRRIRSINKLIRVGKMEVAMVMRVDKEKGYIDLSRRRVTPEDVVKCDERYSKGKAVNSIMRNIAETTGQKLLTLNEKIAWPLGKKPFKTTHEAFRMAISDPDAVFGKLDIDKVTLDKLLTVIRRKLTPQPIRIRADIEVTCFAEEGIDAIREALLAGEAASTKEVPIKIKLIAPPLYVMLTTALEKKSGIAAVNEAIDVVRKSITERSGRLQVKIEPRVTSTQEENQLKSLMERMEMEPEEE
mmetsp:Transcript_17725/g.21509  ORF Transcript_17725/g.21509 Transcript_17725/m.21509 type:complete len:315 (+) Transcript_17725:124-1068(+)|eukprot:CAMPEP_0184022312 /NCGR_PEP_ID=MMETSP0954-20121128/10527_1 /TAXON_ID=627963 /ORGANISM="Aplanochytrium sp, Strain PBS07" /LENGTH=314 /DNA_ID=CAMNT_0026304655 /DNA_START=134 /DNA_END=1078 /DNA_ORIENTATION=+